MGGSIGINNKQVPESEYDQEFFSLFFDNAVLEGEAMLRKDQTGRAAFVEFIKGGSWMEKLTKFENALVEVADKDTDGNDISTWNKYGYENPAEIPRVRSSSNASSITQISSTSSQKSRQVAALTSEALTTQTTINECYSAVAGWTLFFEKTEMQAVLFTALYPLFLHSSEYKLWRNPSSYRISLESASSDSGDSASFSSHFSSLAKSRKAKKSERLRELMVGIAALYDSSELEARLADTQHSWIEDFKVAITALPVNIMVCKMNRDKKESRVVYSNVKALTAREAIPEDEEVVGSGKKVKTLDAQLHPRSDDGNSSSIRSSTRGSARGSTRTSLRGSVRSTGGDGTESGSSRTNDFEFSRKVGLHLHSIHAAGRTPESAKMLEQAIFNARFYKQRFVRPNGEYQLRALKPMFNSHGKYAYTLSLDAFGFADVASVPDLRYPPETVFQHVEDMLALLPLFIKI